MTSDQKLWNHLAQTYNTDRSTLSLEDRARVEQMDADAEAQRAAGRFAPYSTVGKQWFPIGLTDDLQPHPDPRRNRDPNSLTGQTE
jgi:hypothetical protein